jgi:hypothetical protein
MADKQDAGASARQHVAPDGDAYVAGRDVHVHLSSEAMPGASPGHYYGAVHGEGTAVRFLGQASNINPFELHVHPAAWADKSGHEPALTPYLEREHDRVLRDAIRQAVERRHSVFALLVGDSTVGKTRALYEAIRTITRDWPVAFPLEGEELLHWLEAGKITSGTVLWLNESQTYFDAETVGPKVAARLDELLRTVPGIVTVGTLWRQPFLEKYLEQGVQPDKYAPVRHLLKGPRTVRVMVPDYLTSRQRRDWAELAKRAVSGSDQRVLAALDAAGDDGKAMQHLTGGPELLGCFRSGTGFTPVELALLKTVLDARRLGHRSPLPAGVLERASDGYLRPQQRPWDPGWAHAALTALTTGIRAGGGNAGLGKVLTALTAVRTAAGREPGYLPDDYLDQNTREELDDKPAPVELWDALAENTRDPEDLERLGNSAEEQGFYWHAGRLWTKAIRAGSTTYADYLVRLVGRTSPGDIEESTRWVVEQGVLRDPGDTADLLQVLQDLDAEAAVTFVLDQRPAECAVVEAARKVARLIRTLHVLGNEAAAVELAARAAVGVSVNDAYDLAELIDAMYKAGAHSAVGELLQRSPEKHVRLDETYSVEHLLEILQSVGARRAAENLAMRTAKNTPDEAPAKFVTMARSIWLLCGRQVAEEFVQRTADQVNLADASAVTSLIDELQFIGIRATLTKVLERIPVDQIELESAYSASRLLRCLREAGAYAVAAKIAIRAAAQVQLRDPNYLDNLAEDVHALCDPETAKEFAVRIVTQVQLESAHGVSTVLNALYVLGTSELADQLLERTGIDQIKLDDMYWSSRLLTALRKAGVRTSAEILATRAATQVSLEDLTFLDQLSEEIFAFCGPEVTKELCARVVARGRLREASAATSLINILYSLNANELIVELLEKSPVEKIELDSVDSVSDLLQAARKAGASAFAENLAYRAIDQVSLGDIYHRSLVGFAEEVAFYCGPAAVQRLVARVAEHADLTDASTAANLIDDLHHINADKAIQQLLERCPIEQIELGDADSIIGLISALRDAGVGQAVNALAARAAEQVEISDPSAIVGLAGAMRDAGALTESLSLMRRASKVAAQCEGDYSVITEHFAVAESADPQVAVSILLYGPAQDQRTPRPWAWRDLVEPERKSQP